MLKPVLIESSSGVAASGICFGDKYVLTTTHIHDVKSNTYKIDQPTSQLVKCNNLHSVYKVFISENESVTANIKYCFSCTDIEKSISIEIKDWKIDGYANIFKDLFTFFILEIVHSNDSAEDLQHSVQELYNSCARDIQPGDEVSILSTPFGVKHFLNSYSRGIISSVFGPNLNLFLVDFAGVPGCEGGAIFSNAGPLGIILCCIKAWKESSVGLVVGIKLTGLLDHLFRTVFHKEAIVTIHNKTSQLNIANSLAKLFSGSSWGTAVLLNKKSGIFITASHVIDSANLKLYWGKEHSNVKVIFASPKNAVYDLAFLKAEPKFLISSGMDEIKISDEVLKVGDIVFAAGYSLFSNRYSPNPILTRGVVSKKFDSIIHTTCTILPGVSGGALLNNKFELVGIIVANLCLDNIKYPKVNLVIPITAIIKILNTFEKTEDNTMLRLLQTDDKKILTQWNFLGSKL